MKDALIYVDTREQKPLAFPANIVWWSPAGAKMVTKIHTEAKTLQEGDYVLASHPKAGLVERKSGVSELYQNLLTDDVTRFDECVDRLCAYRSPCIYVEATLTEIGRATMVPRRHDPVAPEGKLLDRLLLVLAAHRITLLTGTGATNAGKLAGGTLVARYLIQAAMAADTEIRNG